MTPISLTRKPETPVITETESLRRQVRLLTAMLESLQYDVQFLAASVNELNRQAGKQ